MVYLDNVIMRSYFILAIQLLEADGFRLNCLNFIFSKSIVFNAHNVWLIILTPSTIRNSVHVYQIRLRNHYTSLCCQR